MHFRRGRCSARIPRTQRAWREALSGFADPKYFTTEMYQACVAGKPRLSGALAALQAMHVPDAEQQMAAYAACKQKRLEALVAAGAVSAYPDALRFVQAMAAMRLPLAVASSSKNANEMMRLVQFGPGKSLLDVFAVNVCGREISTGQAGPGDFPACRRGVADRTRAVSRGRGRPRRYRGGSRGQHGSARCGRRA